MAECHHLLRFVRARFAQLDTDGSFVSGPKNLYVTNTGISLVIGYNNEAGDDFSQKNGSGDICFSYLDTDKYKSLTLGISFCDHDPEAQVLLVGGELLVVGGNTIGATLPRVGTAGNARGVSLEGWTLNIEGSGVDATYPYVRHVFGRTVWTPDGKTLENNPIVNAFTGVGRENAAFFDGPANDVIFPSQMASLYSYYGDHDIPDPVCGGQQLTAVS